MVKDALSRRDGGTGAESDPSILTRQEDAELNRLIADICARLISLRGLLVSAMYAFIFVQASGALWRSLLACAAIYILLILPLGRRFIEKAGCFLFLVALFCWIDSPIVNRLLSNWLAKLDAML